MLCKASRHEQRTELDGGEITRERFPRVVVGLDAGPFQDPAAAPGVEDDAGVKRLAAGCDDDAVVLAERGTACGGEVEIERAWMQGMQRGKECLTPLVAEALLAQAGVHEEVVDPREVGGTPVVVQLGGSFDGCGREGIGFLSGNQRAEGFEVSGELGCTGLACGGGLGRDAADGEQRE